ncbi:Putative PilL domain protein [Candidatus Glomeribacter gigasporarum BEG34]|uniref:Putative PilL domain protein n=1 Tax=Candidatus Glomeribacter gigasporarum BEG34 TaxID=1070319 RepID=G2J832_9BURK|nr:toxin co-regulated pilus biosynthesis Q family protein [Candidatus Glomeribacter gigasporarum]CCD28929.1 Putative PilL domain protein [Candidatus Glomeribacter gigasporarum BEG34]
MKKHRVALLSVRILFGIGTSWALNAQAGFVNQANLPPASIRSPTADGQQKDLQSESARPAHVALREGKGHNVTLSDMLSAVVPHDFHAELRGVHPKQILSWQGGKPWDVVLHSALAATPSAHRIETDIDWARKRLVLRESTQAAESAGDTPRAMHWTVRAQDLTLRRTLMRWAAQAGWQVSWDIRVDYPVQLEGAFSGSFTDAVEQFANALRHSDYPLLVCLYEANQVVRVLHYGDRKQCDA